MPATWEIIGTYYAPATGNVRMCVYRPDDGAYINWSNDYDPLERRPHDLLNVSEIPGWIDGTWTTSDIPVVRRGAPTGSASGSPTGTRPARTGRRPPAGTATSA